MMREDSAVSNPGHEPHYTHRNYLSRSIRRAASTDDRARRHGRSSNQAVESYEIGRHEEPTTSRLAQAINDELRRHPISVEQLTLEVHAEEFKRKQEKQTGADLYISLVRGNFIVPSVSKGVLVQAKRRRSLIDSEESRRLGNQSKRMYRRSKTSSYVWINEQDGVVCTKAPRSSRPTFTWVVNPMSVGELIANGLRCTLGDEGIGRDLSVGTLQGVSAVMESVPEALDFTVKLT